MAINDITGDKLVSKSTTQEFRDGWDRIYGGLLNKDKPSNDQFEEVPAQEDLDNIGC